MKYCILIKSYWLYFFNENNTNVFFHVHAVASNAQKPRDWIYFISTESKMFVKYNHILCIYVHMFL